MTAIVDDAGDNRRAEALFAAALVASASSTRSRAARGRRRTRRRTLRRRRRRRQSPASPHVPRIDGADAAAARRRCRRVESLTIDSDFTRFMQPAGRRIGQARGAEEAVRDPRFNVMDGLDIYIDDYTQPDPIRRRSLRAAGAGALHLRSADDRESPRHEDVPPSDRLRAATRRRCRAGRRRSAPRDRRLDCRDVAKRRRRSRRRLAARTPTPTRRRRSAATRAKPRRHDMSLADKTLHPVLVQRHDAARRRGARARARASGRACTCTRCSARRSSRAFADRAQRRRDRRLHAGSAAVRRRRRGRRPERRRSASSTSARPRGWSARSARARRPRSRRCWRLAALPEPDAGAERRLSLGRPAADRRSAAHAALALGATRSRRSSPSPCSPRPRRAAPSCRRSATFRCTRAR